MDAFKSGSDVVFLLMGAVMVLAMHSGFAFLELGTVRKKNQVNALVKVRRDRAARGDQPALTANALAGQEPSLAPPELTRSLGDPPDERA